MRVVDDQAFALMTLWQEARGEPYENIVGVGEVIRNRVKSGKWGTTVAEVVLAPYQFSGWNTKDANRLSAAVLDDTNPLYKKLLAAWEHSATSALTQGATHYFNPDAVQRPAWALPELKTTKLGKHEYYRL